MRVLFVLLITLLLTNSVIAQHTMKFKPLRYDEDYSSLAGDTLRSEYEKIKFIPLSKNRESYISFGGEARFQYFYLNNEDWGDTDQDKDGYTLSRYLFHMDFHVGKRFRLFSQLQSSMVNSRMAASPVEENPLEMHQAFVDFNPVISERENLTVRIGRQELSYGSQRLVSVREAPNNRQAFDAARAIYILGSTKTEVFYGHYVQAGKGIFDDKFMGENTRLWGAYFTQSRLPFIKNADLYYFGLSKRNAKFNDGAGKEIRHSLGTRIFSAENDWKYDAEALYQFGYIGGKNISAWTASVNTSYRFSATPLKPEIGLKAELISGDLHKEDRSVETFNPLFPKGAYFGLAALIGPSNLMDLHPSASFELSPKLSFDVDFDVFWRYSKNDGIYAVNMTMIYPDGDSREKHIGDQLTGTLYYTPNKFLNLRWELTWFRAGNYLKEVGSGKDILYTGVTVQFKF